MIGFDGGALDTCSVLGKMMLTMASAFARWGGQ
jgi:hypothetical protein